MTSSEGVRILVLGLALSGGCGDKAEPFECDDDYTMEQFWTDCFEIYCAYNDTCVASDTADFDHEYCVTTLTSGYVSWCDESGFEPCASWDCIVAWRAEVDALEAGGRLGECPVKWNFPARTACGWDAMMYAHCNTVDDDGN